MRIAAVVRNSSRMLSIRNRPLYITILGILIPLLYCDNQDGTAGLLAQLSSTASSSQLHFFESRIRPLLIEKCLPCHGSKKQESQLRLDSRGGLLRGGLRGPAVDVQAPQESLLLRAISYRDADLKMPPSGPLAPEDVAALRQWIAAGAFWPEQAPNLESPAARAGEHWAFQPVRRPPLPSIRAEWPANPIDLFVYEKLAAAQLQPSPMADRATLCRRLYFDLLGIPPPPEDIDAFVADTAPDAYERWVDRLLASPQYGERWARHWLDVARYADTKGYVFFEDERYPWAYTYRDYVIRAWNEDIAYDQFIVQQIAGDLLAEGSATSQGVSGGASSSNTNLAALGFLTVGGHFMNNTHDIIDDRIDVVMRGVLGLTFTCARCHDHKYDPFTQEEYYSLYGIFASCYEPIVPPAIGYTGTMAEYEQYEQGLKERELKLWNFVTEHHRNLVRSARKRAVEYLMAAYQGRFHPPTDDFMLITDKGDLNPAMILRWHAYLHDGRRLHPRVWAPWRALAELADEEFSQRAPEVLQKCLSGSQPINRFVRQALGELKETFSMADVAACYGRLLEVVDQKWQTLLRDAENSGQATPERLSDDDEEELRQVLYGVDSPADVPMQLDWGFLSLFPDRATQEEYKKLLKDVEQWLTQDQAPARAMVLYDSPRPIVPRVFQRGNPNRPGKVVPRQLPRLLDPSGTPIMSGSGRRQLAETLISPANPLTARVIVNRLWMHHFGRGLVATSGDFGLRGERPSHPELLDWLAAELMGIEGDRAAANGSLRWSLKRIQRLIVCSATYRQASTWRADAMAVDPENRLWWRAPLRRLEFEAQRDALLVVADGWDYRVGGPSVDIWQNHWIPRRTLYGSINRLNMPPLGVTFDVPSPASVATERSVTTTSLQALYWLNNPVVAEAARRVLARPDIAQCELPSERIGRLYRVLFSRPPEPQEIRAAVEYLGDTPAPSDWHRYVHALLMTNEFVLLK